MTEEQDPFYLPLLQECQASDLAQRLRALEALSKSEYLARVPGQFLLDRLNSTSIEREQFALLGVMSLLPSPIPTDALLAIVEDRETTALHLREVVVHTLASMQEGAALDTLLRLLADQSEDIDLRRVIAEDLVCYGAAVPFDALLAALADDDPSIQAGAITAMRAQPALIPIETLLAYRAQHEWYIREAVVKTLLATGQPVPIESILAALEDPEQRVREAAAFGCIRLLEWFGARIPLDPLLKALGDDWGPVRETILDAFGNYPERAPVEAIIAALDDPLATVRCAALETLAVMGERVPADLYPLLQAMSGADPSPQVRQRSSRALLALKGFPVSLLPPITFEPTHDELGE